MKTPLFLLTLLLTIPLHASDVIVDLETYLLNLEDGGERDVAYLNYEAIQGSYNQVTQSIQQVTNLTNVSDTARSKIIGDLRIQSADLNSQVALQRSALSRYDFGAAYPDEMTPYQGGLERKLSQTEFVTLFNKVMRNCDAALVDEKVQISSNGEVIEVADSTFTLRQLNQISDIEFRLKNNSRTIDTYVSFNFYQNEWVMFSQQYQTVVGTRITNYGIFEFMAPVLGRGAVTALNCEVDNLVPFITK